jgi:thymidylate kinase
MKTSRNLFIVDGPDGAGKSTLVREIARTTGATVYHHGPYPGVSDGLERLYAESMMPAVLGYSDVVLDRCWLSERPYGSVFRGGVDRVGVAARQLERLALRCRTVVVLALPPKEVATKNFVRRKGKKTSDEMLESAEQYSKVYDTYAKGFRTALPVIRYDYTAATRDEILNALTDLSGLSSNPHPLAWSTAGSFGARVALIGDSLAEHRNRDVLYRWPFSTFGGPAKWLALRLERAGIPENELFWVNADALDHDIVGWMMSQKMEIVALGSTAESVLAGRAFPADHVASHPNAATRYKVTGPEDYDLIPILRGILEPKEDVTWRTDLTGTTSGLPSYTRQSRTGD